MSYSSELTELFYMLKRSNGSLSLVHSETFYEYLKTKDVTDFCKAVFVYGFEIRDHDYGADDPSVSKLIEVVKEIKQEYFSECSQQNQVIYNIGLINMYLYFCKRSPVQTQVDPTVVGQAIYDEEDDHFLKNIEYSVFKLRDAAILCADTLDLAEGVYKFHTFRLFQYIYDVFDNYRVDNNNEPIDLDSFYVFTDQLDKEDDSLWLELVEQMKVKYDSRQRPNQ